MTEEDMKAAIDGMCIVLVEQRDRIEALEAALREIVDNADNGEWTLPSTFGNRARAAFDQSSPPKAST